MKQEINRQLFSYWKDFYRDGLGLAELIAAKRAAVGVPIDEGREL